MEKKCCLPSKYFRPRKLRESNGYILFLLISRQETDLVLGLMSMSRERKGVVDFCYQIEVGELVLVARKGSLEVDPWAFLSVLSLSTWLLLFLALLASGTALVVLGLSRWARGRYPFSQAVLMDLLRILVQQGMYANGPVRKSGIIFFG